jgi:hypothetical protein
VSFTDPAVAAIWEATLAQAILEETSWFLLKDGRIHLQGRSSTGDERSSRALTAYVDDVIQHGTLTAKHHNRLAVINTTSLRHPTARMWLHFREYHATHSITIDMKEFVQQTTDQASSPRCLSPSRKVDCPGASDAMMLADETVPGDYKAAASVLDVRIARPLSPTDVAAAICGLVVLTK